MTATKQQVFEAFSKLGPKSVCACGHLGDLSLGARTEGNQHAGLIGHGACLVDGCGCQKFSWDRFVADLKIALSRASAEEKVTRRRVR